MKPVIIVVLLLCWFAANSQTLYVPGGIGSNITNQNIGIGISNPSDLLTVYGTGALSTTFQQKITNGTKVLALGANSIAAEIQSQGGVPLYLNKAGNNVILDHITTNLGLGTSQPSEKLEIYGRLKISDPTGGGFNIIVSNGYGGNFNTTQDYSYIAKFRGNTVIGAYDALVITGGADGGKVGIGTSNPDQALTVKGVIHANEVRVDLNSPIEQGPDYVFEKDYDLLPLSELETYITQYKHLPEVPSAKEMEAEGLNLKEMNLLLLKKVEELTLHLIEMKKASEIQANEIESLKLKIK
jgi:hypothetical protein